MHISSHPSVEEVRTTIGKRGVSLACPLCGGGDFTKEDASLRGEGERQHYGSYRLHRVELVCERCSGILSFEAEKLISELD